MLAESTQRYADAFALKCEYGAECAQPARYWAGSPATPMCVAHARMHQGTIYPLANPPKAPKGVHAQSERVCVACGAGLGEFRAPGDSGCPMCGKLATKASKPHAQCYGINKAGNACKRPANGGSPFCARHDTVEQWRARAARMEVAYNARMAVRESSLECALEAGKELRAALAREQCAMDHVLVDMFGPSDRHRFRLASGEVDQRYLRSKLGNFRGELRRVTGTRRTNLSVAQVRGLIKDEVGRG